MNMKREKPPLEVTLLLAACVTATFALVTPELSQRSNDLRGVEERSCSKRQFRTIAEAMHTRPGRVFTESQDSFDPKLVRRRALPFKELDRRRQTSPEHQVDRSDENCGRRTASLIESRKEGNWLPERSDKIVPESSRPEIRTKNIRVASAEKHERRITREGIVVKRRNDRGELTKHPSEEYSRTQSPETKFTSPERVGRNRDNREKQIERPFEEYNRVRYAEIRRLYAQLPHSLRYLDLKEVEREMRQKLDEKNTRMSFSGRIESTSPRFISEDKFNRWSFGRIDRDPLSLKTDSRPVRDSSKETPIRREVEKTRYVSEDRRSYLGEREGVINTKRSAQSTERSFKDKRQPILTRHEDITSNVRIRDYINSGQARERNHTLRTKRKATSTHHMERRTRTDQISRNNAREPSSANGYVVSTRVQRNVRENPRRDFSDIDMPVHYVIRQVQDTGSREREFKESKVHRAEDRNRDLFSRKRQMMGRDVVRGAHSIRYSFHRPAVRESIVAGPEPYLRQCSQNVISSISERKTSTDPPFRDTRQTESRNTRIIRRTDEGRLYRASRPALYNYRNMRVSNNEVQDSSSNGNLETLTNKEIQDHIIIKAKSTRIGNAVLVTSSMGKRRDMKNNAGEVNFWDTSNSKRTNDLNLVNSKGNEDARSNIAHEDPTREYVRGRNKERKRSIRNSEIRKRNEITRIPHERNSQDRNLISGRENKEQRSHLEFQREDRQQETTKIPVLKVESAIARASPNLPVPPNRQVRGERRQHIESSKTLQNFRKPQVFNWEHSRKDYRYRAEHESPSNRELSERDSRNITYEDNVRKTFTMRINSHRNLGEPNKGQLVEHSKLRLNHNDRVNLESNQENREVRTSKQKNPPVNTATVAQTREHTKEFRQEIVYNRFDNPIKLNYFREPTTTTEGEQSNFVINYNRNIQSVKKDSRRGELKRSLQNTNKLEARQIYEQRTREIIQTREGSRNQFRQRGNHNNSQLQRLSEVTSTEATKKDVIQVNVSSESKRKEDYDSVIKLLHLLKDLVIMSCLVLPLADYFGKKKYIDEKVFTNIGTVKNLETRKSNPTILSPEKRYNSLINRFWAKEEQLVSY